MNFKKEKEDNFDINMQKKLSKEFAISMPVVKLLFARGINTKEKLTSFLKADINRLYDPYLLKDMDKMVSRINKAIQNNEKIVIFGDYDVDGMVSTSILYLYLKDQNLPVEYFLPNRYEDDYGLTINAIDKVITSFNPDLIITVDCGITAVKEVEYVKSKGIDILISDHHEVPNQIPDCPVINPKRKDQNYPFNDLCGSGVALKIVQAIGGLKAIEPYLDIAAIATIADIVALKDENRIIVQLGLEIIRKKPKEGIKILLKQLKLSEKTLTSVDVAFKVAPKINASGRLGKAEVGLKLFIEKDKRKLSAIVKELIELNTIRQELCQTIYEEALEKLKIEDISDKKVIVLKDASWDAGLLGIVCARLIDDFNKPTILFQEVDGLLKGSARSIDGIDIHKAIDNLNVPLEAFGGHIMAAGLTVKLEHFNTFKNEINNIIENNFDKTLFIPEKNYDLNLKVSDVTLELAKEVNLLAPFGHKNPMPLFLLSFHNAKLFHMKNYFEHIILNFHKGFHLLHFSGGKYEADYNYFKNKNALIELQLNSYRGKETVKAIIKAINFSKPKLKEISGFVKGNYLEQLNYVKQNTKVVYKKYDATTQTYLENLLNSQTSVLVVCNNTKTYEAYKNIWESKNLQTSLFQVSDKLGINRVVLGLNSFENLKNYENIIFLEDVLNIGYIEALQQYTKAKIHLPNIAYKKQKFYISTNRDVFGTYYNLIRQAQKAKINANNQYFYYEKIKEINKSITNLNYTQFIACVKVFCELNLLKEVYKENKYYLKRNKNITAKLEDSKFYKNLNKRG